VRNSGRMTDRVDLVARFRWVISFILTVIFSRSCDAVDNHRVFIKLIRILLLVGISKDKLGPFYSISE
jgi:hypothetical protein